MHGQSLEWLGTEWYGVVHDQCDGAEHGWLNHELRKRGFDRRHSLGSAEQWQLSGCKLRQCQYDGEYADKPDVIEDCDGIGADEWFDYIHADDYEHGSDDLGYVGDGEGATAEWCDCQLGDCWQWCQLSQ